MGGGGGSMNGAGTAKYLGGKGPGEQSTGSRGSLDSRSDANRPPKKAPNSRRHQETELQQGGRGRSTRDMEI